MKISIRYFVFLFLDENMYPTSELYVEHYPELKWCIYVRISRRMESNMILHCQCQSGMS